ncbi:MAG: DHH family phosphoesterase [Pirellulales bacterium]
MPKLWRIQSHDAAQIAALAKSANVSPVVAQLLACRGMTGAEIIRDFLDCKLTGLRDPAQLGGVEAAAARLMEAVRERRKITVYGDYDVDGMTAASLLLQCLKLLGGEANFYVPRRLEEGYGLNAEALRSLAAAGTKVVVTVDCGIAAVEEARTAAELGLELDHHGPSRVCSGTAASCGAGASAIAGHRVSVRRFERCGRRPQACLGTLPAGRRG